MLELSIVIPAYNEGAKIQWDLVAAHDFLAVQPFQSEVLIVDDGSTDQTREVVQKYIEAHPYSKPFVRLLQYGKNRGKGYAIRYGMNAAEGKYMGFVDAGLCVPYRFITRATQLLEDGADLAIASRRLEGTKIVCAQPLYRRAGSKVFWHLMRAGMGIRVTDTQCGFKFYRAEAAKQIFPRLKTDGFMFDIEALMTADKLGLKISEFPVQWANDGDTRYNPVVGTVRNFRELFKIRLRLLGAPR